MIIICNYYGVTTTQLTIFVPLYCCNNITLKTTAKAAEIHHKHWSAFCWLIIYFCTSWPNLKNRTSKLFRNSATYLQSYTMLQLRRLEFWKVVFRCLILSNSFSVQRFCQSLPSGRTDPLHLEMLLHGDVDWWLTCRITDVARPVPRETFQPELIPALLYSNGFNQ